MIKAHESNINKNARMKRYKYDTGRDIVDKGVNDGSSFLNIWVFWIKLYF